MRITLTHQQRTALSGIADGSILHCVESLNGPKVYRRLYELRLIDGSAPGADDQFELRNVYLTPAGFDLLKQAIPHWRRWAWWGVTLGFVGAVSTFGMEVVTFIRSI